MYYDKDVFIFSAFNNCFLQEIFCGVPKWDNVVYVVYVWSQNHSILPNTSSMPKCLAKMIANIHLYDVHFCFKQGRFKEKTNSPIIIIEENINSTKNVCL